ncbi:MAG: ATP-binding protein [Candidatus Saccharimonadales bacterium]
MIDDTRVLSKQLVGVIIGIGLLIAFFIFYFVEIIGHIPTHYNSYVTYFLYFANVLATPILGILATKYSQLKLPAIIWVHITFMMTLLFFNEINGPFTYTWSLLILFTSIYYGWYGFIASSLTLLLMTALYIIFFGNDLKPDLFGYLAVALMVNFFTIFTSYLFVQIIMSVRHKNKDIENAQKAEMLQANRHAALLNSISDAVMTLNRYGRVTSQNASAQAFFDTNQSLVGKDIDKLLELQDDTGVQFAARNLIEQTKTTSLRDDLLTINDGSTRNLSIQMSRIRSTFDDSEEYGVVMIIRDITKQKTLEEEKDEFISVTSHELRTPVTIAEGSLSNLLLLEERDADKEKLHEAAETAHEQVLYLAKMINDLSTLSRAERGVGDAKELINVNELLHDLFVKYTPEANKKSLLLDLDIHPDVPGIETSRLYVEEIIENFLTNALKYTKEGTITLGAEMDTDNKIRFWVKDTGIGMSKSDKDHIFEKFYRSEDYRTRETSGTGLGLYVVSKLATKLNTRIDVESRLNHGSTFSFAI